MWHCLMSEVFSISNQRRGHCRPIWVVYEVFFSNVVYLEGTGCYEGKESLPLVRGHLGMLSSMHAHSLKCSSLVIWFCRWIGVRGFPHWMEKSTLPYHKRKFISL